MGVSVATTNPPSMVEPQVLVTEEIKSLLTKELGVCNDWDGLLGFILIRKRDDGTKYCNQLSCTTKSCEFHLLRDEMTQEAL